MHRLFIALLLILGFTTAASAQRAVFNYYGSQGDAGATDECMAPNAVFIGVVGNTGAWLDQITVVCGKLLSDRSVSGSVSLPSRGGAGGAFKSTLCGRDEVITSISPARSKSYQIDKLRITCTNLKRNSVRFLSFDGADWYYGRSTQSCAAGSVATGMTIRYGQHVNGLGLICNGIAAVAIAAPSFVTVLLDVDVYKKPSGNKADKLPDPLRAGTPSVKLLENRAPWFRVQWSGNVGWVYSGDGYVSLLLP